MLSHSSPTILTSVAVLMVLRVYAMWGQSKSIIGVLLLVYISAFTLQFINVGMYINRGTHYIVTETQLGDISSCAYTYIAVFTRVTVALECILGFLLFVFAIVPVLKELRMMYAVTKRLQLNRYMKLLAREGIIYFSVNVPKLPRTDDFFLQQGSYSTLLPTGQTR
ncbi:hypothetical protein J3R82DRAFT_8238 [Butyriboletus roseoflavus]|nr:hypothetical protein J3R82DRAFT_8238 [Butyriboletus roseoflavus]